jgi:DTW domain-containing protein YfiP
VGIRGSVVVRCEGCRLHEVDCICAAIHPLDVDTNVTVFVHAHERQRVSNTGHLVAQMVRGAELLVFGDKDEALHFDPEDGRRQLLLYPGGRPLVADDRLVASTLLVPDGSWHQARHMTRRVAVLRDAEHVSVPTCAREPFLRFDPRADHLCTLEAVARALGVLASPRIEEHMLAVLRTMVRRTLGRRNARGARGNTGVRRRIGRAGSG